jgi:hypothetical protein
MKPQPPVPMLNQMNTHQPNHNNLSLHSSFKFKHPLGTQFSRNLNLCSSLQSKDQLSHKFKTTGKGTNGSHILSIAFYMFGCYDKKMLSCMMHAVFPKCINLLKCNFYLWGLQPLSLARRKGFFLYPLCPDQLWGSPSLLHNGYRGSFPRGKARPGRESDHSPQSSAEVENE